MEVRVYFIWELMEAQVAFITSFFEQSVEDICLMKLDIIYPCYLLCYLLTHIRVTRRSSIFMSH